MVNKVTTATVIGLNAYKVDVEVDVVNSLPGISIVGLPDAATFLISSFCSPTKSMSERSVSSPEVLSVHRPRYMYSPATTIFRSQFLATDAALST